MTNLILFLYALTSSLGLILLKLGSRAGALIEFENYKLHFNLGLYTIGGIVLYGLSFLIYTYLVSKNDLGYIIPISTALVYVFIFLASYVIFKEAFTAAKIVGICLIFGGIVFLSLNK